MLIYDYYLDLEYDELDFSPSDTSLRQAYNRYLAEYEDIDGKHCETGEYMLTFEEWAEDII